MTVGMDADSVVLSSEFLRFVDASPSPYHAAASVSDMLRRAGFVAISESSDWEASVVPGGRYFFTRGGSSLVAFSLPAEDTAPPPSFTVIGAHTDSPCFKVKPVSNITPTHGYLQVGVECYGGGLWHTWFDRDLGIAGRVIVRQQGSGELSVRLVHIKKPILRIPNLAIHLTSNYVQNGFKVDREKHTVPILGLEAVEAQLNGLRENKTESEREDMSSAARRHPSALLALLAEELGVLPVEIVDLDLCLTDTQPSAVGGVDDEFILAPRLDNLASCFTACHSFIRSLRCDAHTEARNGDTVRMITLFDHEEVGSCSAHGADSPLVSDTMHRIADVLDADYWTCVRRSFLISADMAHAVHPNYADKHESKHRPTMGGGLVIKTNQNQRYATSGLTGFVLREVARRAGGIPIQEFVVANGTPCGSTIGPVLSSRSGLRTVDVGQPQLAMHSIREMCHVGDMGLSEKLFHAFFTHFREVDDEITSSAEILE
jgi:aspartyl aminopeptidase